MPTQKRPNDSHRNLTDQSHEDLPSPPPSDDDAVDGAAYESQSSTNEEEDDDDDDEEQEQEYIEIKLSDIRKEVQCPICLGIIRKTRTVMECLHRFCRECIDKSMRLGNNECPACRTHCPSRRSLRDDPNYDALIAALYPDIDSYEEEELAFHEDEKARNKQIQDSIAQTIRRQAEALGRKRTAVKTTLAALSRRSQRNGHSRGRRNHRTADVQASDDDMEDANGDGAKISSSSAEEQSPETKPKRYKRTRGGRPTENTGSSSGLVGPSERLAWGKGGIRSNTRYNSANRNSRIHKLADHLRNLEENNTELDIQLMLVPLEGRIVPSLQQPYLCCRPSLSVKHLCQYVARQTNLQPDEVRIYLVKESNFKLNPSTSTDISISAANMIDPKKDELQVLEEQETLAGLKTCNIAQGNLILVYQRKLSDSKIK